MKTIIITTSMFGNGVSNYYKSLGNEFLKNNYQVIYIFDGKKNILIEPPINCNYYSWPNKRPTKLKDFIFFIKIIKRHKPNIVISNFGSTNVVAIVSYFFKIKNRLNYIHTPSKAVQIDSKNKYKTAFYKLRKKYIYKLHTHILTNSQGNKTDAINEYSIQKNKISVIPLSVKNTTTKYVPYSNRNHSIVIVGVLSKNKGHSQLLKQFKLCLIQFPFLTLNIIGTGEQLGFLKDLCFQLEITAKVNFLGKISNEKIGEHFSKNKIGISASYSEAFGLVNLESLREGTPILCTKTEGALDIVKEGVNGEFFNPTIEGSFLNSFIKIMNNWDAYSKGALETFNQYYNQEIVVKKDYQRILEKIK